MRIRTPETLSDGLRSDRSATHARTFSPRSFLFSSKDGCRETKREIRVHVRGSEIHARVPTRWTNAKRPQSRRHIPGPGEASRGGREREKERHPRRWDHTRRSRHLLDTAWACRVPRTRGTHGIVHFVALSRGVSRRQRAVQLYGRSRLRATRIDARRGAKGVGWRGQKEAGRVAPESARARDECDPVRGL